MKIQNIKIKMFKVFNKISFGVNGIKLGLSPKLIGKIDLKVAKSSTIIIGNNFNCLSGLPLNPLSRNLRSCLATEKNAKIIIGNNVGISSSTVWSHKMIMIKDNVKIGANTIIVDSDCHSLNYLFRRNYQEDSHDKKCSEIIIEEDVLVGANSIILKGVTIERKAIIGAGSVVTKSIPANCIAAGNPCKVIKYLNKVQ